MAQPSSARPIQSSASEARELLFKADRPRAIDEHIDYFGEAQDAQPEHDDDACGEQFMERLA